MGEKYIDLWVKCLHHCILLYIPINVQCVYDYHFDKKLDISLDLLIISLFDFILLTPFL